MKWTLIPFCALALLVSRPGFGEDPKDKTSDPKPTFEQTVLPILKAKCLQCHSGDMPKAGLNLSTHQGVLRGGRSGAVIRRAAAESSLMWARIAAGEMPPDGVLTRDEKSAIRLWINEGALGPEKDSTSDTGTTFEIDRQDREFWSFKSPRRTNVPTVLQVGRVRNPVDAFVLRKLESLRLSLSETADRATLVRRAYFDLVGLPPTPEVVEAFQRDDRPDAFEKLLERLLSDPAYGERWGRHWLDIAGYADSAGILYEDRVLPLAYRFRDYVIRALNEDKPYDRFLQEQIAGDELVDYWHHYDSDETLSDDIIEAITATGYLRTAPDPSRPDFSTIKNANAQYYYPTINDTIQIVASSTMALTVQCARCHNHKFDPISQLDFYQLQAVFMGAYRPTNWVPQMERRLTTLTKKQETFAQERNAEVTANLKDLEKQVNDLRQEFKTRRFNDQIAKLPADMREEVRTALSTPVDKRDETQLALAKKHETNVQPDDKKLTELLPAEYPAYKKSLAELNKAMTIEKRRRIKVDHIRAIYDLPGQVPTPFLRRGDALTPGHNVSPGTLTILNELVPFRLEQQGKETRSSGRRLAFARWLTDPNHPLTARVIVNRIWLHHFGRGIVATPDDFGRAGSPPSHPELLDWLAVELVENGWSLKHIHRLIMTSNTYMQSSRLSRSDSQHHERAADPHAVDPDNVLLWRQRIRRLEAESLRDAVLHVSGTIHSEMYGAPVTTYRWPNGEVTISNGADYWRRSVYVQNRRLYPLTMLNAFDQPVMATNCTLRSQSTVSTQALTLLNSKAMIQAADAFATRVLRDDPDDPSARAVWLAFGRTPTLDEHVLLRGFLDAQRARHQSALKDSNQVQATRQAVADMCHMLLSSNEFIYVD